MTDVHCHMGSLEWLVLGRINNVTAYLTRDTRVTVCRYLQHGASLPSIERGGDESVLPEHESYVNEGVSRERHTYLNDRSINCRVMRGGDGTRSAVPRPALGPVSGFPRSVLFVPSPRWPYGWLYKLRW